MDYHEDPDSPGLSAYLDDGEYWSEGDKFSGVDLPDEFWQHYESATGEKVSNRKRESFFSCGC